MDDRDAASAKGEDSSLEEAARERLGIEAWDRPLIFRDTAEAATDTRLPYWSMIFLSGAIASLGLALNNAAVVIGAMLIAPLLAPVMGLALALAVGDVRLASQAGIAVIVSTALVIVTAMLLTLVLPFHTFTSEITARTRPTTLDLGIAVFSGLAGVIVSVTRRKGLSAAAWAARTRWFPSFGPIRSPIARIGLVVAFVLALGIPLTITLTEIARETRIQRALPHASQIFEVEGRSSILSLEPVIGENESRAILRVATTEWFGDESRETFERIASAQARESVRLVLEQLPTSSGDLSELAELFPLRRRVDQPTRPPNLKTAFMPAREQINAAMAALSVPDDIRVAGAEILLGQDLVQLTVGYTGDDPMSSDVRQILRRQLRMALEEPALAVEWQRVVTDTLTLTGTSADTTRLRELAHQIRRFGKLRVAMLADTLSGSEPSDSTVAQLIRHGVARAHLDLPPGRETPTSRPVRARKVELQRQMWVHGQSRAPYCRQGRENATKASHDRIRGELPQPGAPSGVAAADGEKR
jgi:uncharacterized hydrophobic protein (TIGR00271 family)